MASRVSLRTFVFSVVLLLTLFGGGQAAASVRTSSYDDGSSGGGGASSGSALIDETDRAIALINLNGGPATVAINGRGTVPLSETERVLASGGAGEPVHHMTVNARSIQLIESTFAPGGVLAGGEPEVAVEVNRGQPF